MSDSALSVQNSSETALSGLLSQIKADVQSGKYFTAGWRKIEDLEARRAAVDAFIDTHMHKSATSSDGIPTFVLDKTLSDRTEYLMVQQRLAAHLGLSASSVRIQNTNQEAGLLNSRAEKVSTSRMALSAI